VSAALLACNGADTGTSASSDASTVTTAATSTGDTTGTATGTATERKDLEGGGVEDMCNSLTCGADNLDVDPLFAGADDRRPEPASPLLDAGDEGGAVRRRRRSR
jgi:hypothetical protein